jgi:quercetin dioxygenase-like cupin family protein
MGGTTVVANLVGLELEEHGSEIYDRPIGLRLLHADDRTGAVHYLIRYPEGLQALRHTHTAAHTIVVIQGALSVDGRVVPAGSYVHFPAGVPMHHAPAPGTDCLFVIAFDGPLDVTPVDDS